MGVKHRPVSSRLKNGRCASHNDLRRLLLAAVSVFEVSNDQLVDDHSIESDGLTFDDRVLERDQAI